mgnify:CR=1 FL=1
MKALQNENLKELTEKVYNLISVTAIQMQLKNITGKDMAVLSKYFARDLIQENSFKRLTFNQIEDAFHEGIRSVDEKKFIDIPTFYKWVRRHKKIIDEAEYKVRTLNQDPKQVPYYQKPIKLLK